MIKVAVGCGKRNYGEDWIHVDGVKKFKHVDGRYDIRLSQLDNGSVDLIYACHLIAYFDRDQVVGLLRSWYSKLKSGGILRIATPDFYVMANLLVCGQVALSDILGPLYGKWPLNDGMIYHRTSYDSLELTWMLEDLRYRDVRDYDWRDTEHAQVDDHSQAYLYPKGDKIKGTLISLNLECTK